MNPFTDGTLAAPHRPARFASEEAANLLVDSLAQQVVLDQPLGMERPGQVGHHVVQEPVVQFLLGGSLSQRVSALYFADEATFHAAQLLLQGANLPFQACDAVAFGLIGHGSSPAKDDTRNDGAPSVAPAMACPRCQGTGRILQTPTTPGIPCPLCDQNPLAAP